MANHPEYNRGLETTNSEPPLDCSQDEHQSADYQVQVSYKAQDADWDVFLAETPGGYQTQTSAWVQVKGLVGRDAVRVIARENGQIVVPFGDRVVTKTKGWSGSKRSLGPNYLIDWVTIKWAPKQGYQYYDFEGIDADIAQSALENALQPAQIEHGPTRYKLSFGGRVVVYPDAYKCVFNPLLRWGYRALFPGISDLPAVKGLVGHLRTS